jgi:F-type H+-transporting ATPase subunit epsilon
MANLRLEIITPERILFQQEVMEVQIPTQNGEIGVLPGHTPIISQLAMAGLLKYRDEANRQGSAVVGNGFVEVSNDKVTILASLAEMPQEINVENARRELESAERSLKAAEKDPDIDVQEALVKIERAAIRVQAAQNQNR